MPPTPAHAYLSYLLRLRRVQTQPPLWQASLQDARSGEWRHFADLTELFAFIGRQVGDDAARPATESGPPGL